MIANRVEWSSLKTNYGLHYVIIMGWKLIGRIDLCHCPDPFACRQDLMGENGKNYFNSRIMIKEIKHNDHSKRKLLTVL